MSVEFVDVFFPLSAYLLRSRHGTTFETLFPSELQKLCPKPVLWLGLDWKGGHSGLPVYWPTLLPLTLIGILIGLNGHSKLLVGARGKCQRPPTPSWSLAMAFYAVMNVSALGCHCLVSRHSVWKAPLVSMDVAATACCSFSAMYACITDELSGGRPAGPTTTETSAKRKRRMMDLLMGCGILNISAFMGSHVPFMLELLYIGMSVAAAIVVGRYIRRRTRVGRQGRWIALLYGGAVLALYGVPLDAHLCRWFGPHINHVTLLFTGCHLIILALYLYVTEDLAAVAAAAEARAQLAAAGQGLTAGGVGAAKAGSTLGRGMKGGSARHRRR